MGDWQNNGPFLGPYYNTGPNTGPNVGDPKRDHNFDNPLHPMTARDARSGPHSAFPGVPWPVGQKLRTLHPYIPTWHLGPRIRANPFLPVTGV